MLAATLLSLQNQPAQAQTTSVTFTVDSHAGPWSFASAGLNSAFQYGRNDQIAPLIVSGANGFSFAAGGTFTIAYVSGTTSAGSSYPSVDAVGYTGLVTNGNTGSSGGYFPSRYFNSSDYPTYLVELVGTFANDSGAIIGTPFAIANLRSVIVPAGATRLQLGVNDDIFPDNSGALTVRITGPVPEPATSLLWTVGIVGVLGLARRQKPNATLPTDV